MSVRTFPIHPQYAKLLRERWRSPLAHHSLFFDGYEVLDINKSSVALISYDKQFGMKYGVELHPKARSWSAERLLRFEGKSAREAAAVYRAVLWILGVNSRRKPPPGCHVTGWKTMFPRGKFDMTQALMFEISDPVVAWTKIRGLPLLFAFVGKSPPEAEKLFPRVLIGYRDVMVAE